MVVRPAEVLCLYKTLLKEASKFPAYNFRMYALRRIQDKFRENKSLLDPKTIESEYYEGLKMLEVIKRQVLIGSLYETDKLVIETMKKPA